MVSPLNQRTIDKMMPIVGFYENGHFVAVARCDTPGCGTESRWTSEAAPKDHRVVFTKFRDRKWHANKRGLTCPKCVAQKKAPPVREFKREPTPPMKPIAEALAMAVRQQTPITTELRPRPLGQDGDHPPPPTPFLEPAIRATLAEGEDLMPALDTLTTPTDKARAAKRAAYDMLLANYDVGNKRYNGEWSDRRIAEQSGLSEAKVASLRDEDFGPAGPPPQLIDLKTRITTLEAKLRQKETMVLQAMDEIPQMQEEVKLCQSQLQSLIAAHGWSS